MIREKKFEVDGTELMSSCSWYSDGEKWSFDTTVNISTGGDSCQISGSLVDASIVKDHIDFMIECGWNLSPLPNQLSKEIASWINRAAKELSSNSTPEEAYYGI